MVIRSVPWGVGVLEGVLEGVTYGVPWSVVLYCLLCCVWFCVRYCVLQLVCDVCTFDGRTTEIVRGLLLLTFGQQKQTDNCYFS